MLKRRHLYVVLFAFPAFLVSGIAAASLLAASAGALWLYVFGDNPWPAGAGTLLGAVFVLSGTLLWLALLAAAYMVGKREEARPALNRAHVALSAGVTIVLLALIGIRVASVKFAGAQSEEISCADYCRNEGYSASGTSPRNDAERFCSCYDSQGREARHRLLSEMARGSR